MACECKSRVGPTSLSSGGRGSGGGKGGGFRRTRENGSCFHSAHHLQARVGGDSNAIQPKPWPRFSLQNPNQQFQKVVSLIAKNYTRPSHTSLPPPDSYMYTPRYLTTPATSSNPSLPSTSMRLNRKRGYKRDVWTSRCSVEFSSGPLRLSWARLAPMSKDIRGSIQVCK